MKLKVTVNSVANDTEYGGEQLLQVAKGEYLLDEIFRLPFFRIIIDEIIGGAVCFRLMEGADAHYFVLVRRNFRGKRASAKIISLLNYYD